MPPFGQSCPIPFLSFGHSQSSCALFYASLSPPALELYSLLPCSHWLKKPAQMLCDLREEKETVLIKLHNQNPTDKFFNTLLDYKK